MIGVFRNVALGAWLIAQLLWSGALDSPSDQDG